MLKFGYFEQLHRVFSDLFSEIANGAKHTGYIAKTKAIFFRLLFADRIINSNYCRTVNFSIGKYRIDFTE